MFELDWMPIGGKGTPLTVFWTKPKFGYLTFVCNAAKLHFSAAFRFEPKAREVKASNRPYSLYFIGFGMVFCDWFLRYIWRPKSK